MPSTAYCGLLWKLFCHQSVIQYLSAPSCLQSCINLFIINAVIREQAEAGDATYQTLLKAWEPPSGWGITKRWDWWRNRWNDRWPDKWILIIHSKYSISWKATASQIILGMCPLSEQPHRDVVVVRGDEIPVHPGLRVHLLPLHARDAGELHRFPSNRLRVRGHLHTHRPAHLHCTHQSQHTVHMLLHNGPQHGPTHAQ